MLIKEQPNKMLTDLRNSKRRTKLSAVFMENEISDVNHEVLNLVISLTVRVLGQDTT
jgi:DUF971 family protein